MGVFDAMTRVVLEAGRLDGAERKALRDKEPERTWRVRLAYVPVMGAVAAMVLGGR